MGDHRLFAAAYDLLQAPAERAGLAERRRRLLSAARGQVLEVGGGTGANLPHYPAGVERLVVVEPDEGMRRRLERRLSTAPVAVEVLGTGIEEARLPEASFDAVVCTLVLCTVPDLDAALLTVRRLLAPEGTLLFLEHVRGPGWCGHVQRAVTPVWRRAAGGCHPGRDILAAIRAAGFVVTDVERFTYPIPNPVVRPAVQGLARARARSTSGAGEGVATEAS